MRVLICGGRDYNDYRSMGIVLEDVIRGWGTITTVIHGGARGADALAGQWAREHNIPSVVFPAEWEKHGRAAGPIRNEEMLREGDPDLVVAFPGGRGTADMVRRSRNAGKPVLEVGK